MDFKTIDEMEADIIQKALIANEFSITETAKALGIGRATVYRKITEYKLKMRAGDLPDFKLDTKEELRKAVKLVQDVLDLCDHAADFRNGNTHNGIDEGQSRASEFLYSIEQALTEIKNRNNL